MNRAWRALLMMAVCVTAVTARERADARMPPIDLKHQITTDAAAFEAEVHRIADAGHYVLEDARDEVVPRIKQFLSRDAES